MEEITFLREYKARLFSETNNRIEEILEEVEELI